MPSNQQGFKPDISQHQDLHTPDQSLRQPEIKPDLVTKPEIQKPTEVEKAQQEYTDKTHDDQPEQSPYVIPSAKPTPSSTQAAAKSKVLEEVEEILSEDLDDFYNSLDETKKPEFKAKGEEVATVIEGMVLHFKTRARKVISLIKEWLLTVPGINKYFLEQESKIRTQKILSFARKYKRENKK